MTNGRPAKFDLSNGAIVKLATPVLCAIIVATAVAVSYADGLVHRVEKAEAKLGDHELRRTELGAVIDKLADKVSDLGTEIGELRGQLRERK